MKQIPRISIVLPVYNGAKYLKDSIESILHQSFNDFELIVIDDGSLDKTFEIIHRYNDNRINIIHHSINKGLVYSLNEGVKVSRAEYIARMDADDIALPDRLEKQLEAFEANKNLGVLGTQIALMDETCSFEVDQHHYPQSHSEIIWRMLFENTFAHPTIMVRKKVFTQAYREEYKHAEDYDLWTRLTGDAIFGNLSQKLLLYRRHSETVSHLQNAVQDQHTKIIQKNYFYKVTGRMLSDEEGQLLTEINKRSQPLSNSQLHSIIDLLFTYYLGIKEKQLAFHVQDPVVYSELINTVTSMTIWPNNQINRETIRDKAKEILPIPIYSLAKRLKILLPISIRGKLYRIRR